MAILEKKYVKSKISTLNSSLQDTTSLLQKENLIKEHLVSIKDDSQFQMSSTVVEFPSALDWFNTSSPLSFSDQLRGKIVVLDFFTYCCVNCIHVLPDLSTLEKQYSVEEGVVVVGVHSAKFTNEKTSDNIRDAIGRYGITHPVVNDVQIELWERLGVTCWPTLVIVGPQRELLYYIIGEGHGKDLRLFMRVAVEHYQQTGLLSKAAIPVSLGSVEAQEDRKNALYYPGKVCFDDTGEKLFVADSSNHRILMVDWNTGRVLKVFGSGEAGLLDGEGIGAQFNGPQGLAYYRQVLYVADTENHALRKVDLTIGNVSTIAGTGCQGNDKEGGLVGVAQELSSPWDLELGKSAESDHPDVLYIAMAGSHQIWLHFLEDAMWTKGSRHVAGSTLRLSGSGDEANRNNSYPHKAAFAQPSGLSASPDGSVLYVADSESSTVRAVQLPGGSVKALVGGAIDPLDLFAFGDQDGKGREVRLQHPLGVACNKTNEVVYIADSYNHKIKMLSVKAKTCATLAGTGSVGLVDGTFEHAQFSEPGGICLRPQGDQLIVADTNNHSIRVLHLEKKEVSKFQISFFKRLTGKKATIVTVEPFYVQKKGEVEVKISFGLPPSCHWTPEAPSNWQILPEENEDVLLMKNQPMQGTINESAEVSIHISTALEEGQCSQLKVEAALYYCEESGLCHVHGVVLQLPLHQSSSCEGSTSKELSYTPPLPLNQ